jgi:hypothetical protein
MCRCCWGLLGIRRIGDRRGRGMWGMEIDGRWWEGKRKVRGESLWERGEGQRLCVRKGSMTFCRACHEPLGGSLVLGSLA